RRGRRAAIGIFHERASESIDRTMRPIWKFRLFSLLVVIVVGALSAANLVAEVLRPAPMTLPSRSGTPATSEQLSAAQWASQVAPFRSDLKANYALALAGRALVFKDNEAQNFELAKQAAEAALKAGPHDSRMWLLLALLQGRGNADDPIIA